MPGVSSETGRYLGEREHVEQSIRDIVLTPIGTRVHRREYGSDLMFLLDRPKSPSTLLAMQTTVARAVRRWEPRIRVERVLALARTPQGPVEITVRGTIIATGETISAGLVVPGPPDHPRGIHLQSSPSLDGAFTFAATLDQSG